MVRFLLADDHTIVRRGLKQILLEEFPLAFIDEVDNGESLLQKVLNDNWDLVISDLMMPHKNALEVIYEIKKTKPLLPFLIISVHSEEQYAIRAIKSGSSGYLKKDMAPEELIKAVNHIMAGNRYITASLANQLSDFISSKPMDDIHLSLSEREFNVFKHIAAGKSITEIAELTSVTPSTISTYKGRILTKMNLKTNADLTMYATKKNLL